MGLSVSYICGHRQHRRMNSLKSKRDMITGLQLTQISLHRLRRFTQIRKDKALLSLKFTHIGAHNVARSSAERIPIFVCRWFVFVFMVIPSA